MMKAAARKTLSGFRPVIVTVEPGKPPITETIDADEIFNPRTSRIEKRRGRPFIFQDRAAAVARAQEIIRARNEIVSRAHEAISNTSPANANHAAMLEREATRIRQAREKVMVIKAPPRRETTRQTAAQAEISRVFDTPPGKGRGDFDTIL